MTLGREIGSRVVTGMQCFCRAPRGEPDRTAARATVTGRSRRHDACCDSLAPVTVLIDEARWWWRDRKWCHLVSDESLDELWAFADAAGLPRRGFQGDHYDIPDEHRAELIAAGAVEVESRELVRRLRAAGLRLTPAQRRARAAHPSSP